MKNGTAKTYSDMIRNFKEDCDIRGVKVTQAHIDALNGAFCDFVFNRISISMVTKEFVCDKCKTEIKHAFLKLALDLGPGNN